MPLKPKLYRIDPRGESAPLQSTDPRPASSLRCAAPRTG
jgi:hypothetical protein